MRYQVTRTFDTKNVKGKLERSQRVYVGEFKNREEAVTKTEARFNKNEPTATGVFITVEKVGR